MRPNNPMLLNSRAYAFASLNLFDKAEAALASIPKLVPEWMQSVAEANRGLITIRRGMSREGISYYENAIDGFQRLGLGLMALSAKTYLSR